MKDLGNKLKNKSSIIMKSMSIIDILASSSRPLNFSEILSASGLAKSSTHRLLSILQYEGLIDYDQSYKTYGLGNRSSFKLFLVVFTCLSVNLSILVAMIFLRVFYVYNLGYKLGYKRVLILTF